MKTFLSIDKSSEFIADDNLLYKFSSEVSIFNALNTDQVISYLNKTPACFDFKTCKSRL